MDTSPRHPLKQQDSTGRLEPQACRRCRRAFAFDLPVMELQVIDNHGIVVRRLGLCCTCAPAMAQLEDERAALRASAMRIFGVRGPEVGA